MARAGGAHGPAADAAAEQAGQQALGVLPGNHRPGRTIGPDRLDPIEQILIDDAGLGRIVPLPLLARIDPGQATTGFRIAHHPGPIPDASACIDVVGQHAIGPRLVADDGRDVPQGAPRRRDPFPVQRDGNLSRCAAGRIVLEDATDGAGLVLDDRQASRLAGHRTIAVAASTGAASLTDHARHAAARLGAQVLQEDFSNDAAQPGLHDVEGTATDGMNLDIEMGKRLADGGEIGQVAGDSIGALDQDDVEAALAGVSKDLNHAFPADQARAALRAVAVLGDKRPAHTSHMAAAELQLVFDRLVALQVGAKAGVERNATGGHRNLHPRAWTAARPHHGPGQCSGQAVVRR